MKSKITLNMTLEEYNKKYSNKTTSLAKHSKLEVSEHDKQNNYTSKGDNDHLLLKNHNWALIGDTYYEVPKTSIVSWFKGLNRVAQVAICVLGVGAITTAIVVPIVVTANRGASENKITISKEYADVVAVESSKTLDTGDLQIILKFKETNGKRIVIDNVLIGGTKLTNRTDYVVFNNTIVIKSNVINSHKNANIAIAPRVIEGFDPTQDFQCDNPICDMYFIKKVDNDYVYNITVNDEKRKEKKLTGETEYVKVGNYELTKDDEYSIRQESGLFLTIKGEVFDEHQGMIAANPIDDYAGVDIFHPADPVVLGYYTTTPFAPIDKAVMGNIPVGSQIGVFFEVGDPTSEFSIALLPTNWNEYVYITAREPNPFYFTYTESFKNNCSMYSDGMTAMTTIDVACSISRILYQEP